MKPTAILLTPLLAISCATLSMGTTMEQVLERKGLEEQSGAHLPFRVQAAFHQVDFPFGEPNGLAREKGKESSATRFASSTCSYCLSTLDTVFSSHTLHKRAPLPGNPTQNDHEAHQQQPQAEDPLIKRAPTQGGGALSLKIPPKAKGPVGFLPADLSDTIAGQKRTKNGGKVETGRDAVTPGSNKGPRTAKALRTGSKPLKKGPKPKPSHVTPHLR